MTRAAPTWGTISRAGWSRLSFPFSTSCMAAVAVMAFVMEAIHTTVSRVMGAGLPSSRTPNAFS